MTPILSKRRRLDLMDQDGHVETSRPARQAWSRDLDSRICSRLRTGSASMFSSATDRPPAAATRSRIASTSVEDGGGGASSDLQHRQRQAGICARRVDGDVGRIPKPLRCGRPC